MDSLPGELVLAVAAWLSDEDVLRLRLVRVPLPPGLLSAPASTLKLPPGLSFAGLSPAARNNALGPDWAVVRSPAVVRH